MGNVSGWAEGILLSLAFIVILTLVIGNFNILYGQNNDIGINDETTQQRFIQYADTSQGQLQGADVEFDARQGVTVKQSWGLVLDVTGVIWGFLTGGFIEQIFSATNLGESGVILAGILRILWFLSLIFALLYALFKVVV